MNLTSFGYLCVISSLCLNHAHDAFFYLTIAYILYFTLNIISDNYVLLMLLKIKGLKHELLKIAMK